MIRRLLDHLFDVLDRRQAVRGAVRRPPHVTYYTDAAGEQRRVTTQTYGTDGSTYGRPEDAPLGKWVTVRRFDEPPPIPVIRPGESRRVQIDLRYEEPDSSPSTG